MISRTLIRIALAVLLLGGQLVGVRGATGASQSAPARAFSCCCIGECHCTGDCCNHGPDQLADKDRPSLRKAGAGPVFQSPKSCGAWQGTLNSGPAHTRLEPPEALRLLNPNSEGRRRPVRHALYLPCSRALLRQISPRAPPDLHPSPASA